MEFTNKAPDWSAAGIEPPASLKSTGFQAGDKPPAPYFNWFWTGVSACLAEILEKLANVDETKDVDKYVKFAQEAGVARKSQGAITIRFDGGRTEGTNQFTYDGNVAKSVNITPEKINAAAVDLDNVDAANVRQKANAIVAAASSDGAAYTATVEGVTALQNGMIITIIPAMTSTTTAPTLNVNNLGAIPIRLPLSINNAIMTQPENEGYYMANRPITLQYDSGYLTTGVWKTLGKQRTSATDLYGDFNLENLGDIIIADSTPATVENGKWYLIKSEV